MRRVPFYLVLLLTACADDGPLSPDEWRGEDTGACSPPERAYDDFPGTAGVFGYVKVRACTAGCDDVFEELPSQRVIVFDDALPDACAPDELGWPDDPSLDPVCGEHVVAEAESDDQGRFEIVLPPGDYLVVTDTVVFDAWDGKSVIVAEGFPQFVSFYFDAVPI